MAFPAASGWGNLPLGNWSPIIYSQRVIKAFRIQAVAEDVTNTDYSGEIANYGDTVNIITEPDITVSPYVRGQTLVSQPIVDNQIQMVIKYANSFQFAVDDIEKKISHLNWAEMATSRAAYKLANAFDSEVLTYMSTAAQSANTLGANTTSAGLQTVGYGASAMTPFALLNRLKRYLDVANVPEGDRFMVASPYFWEYAGSEDAKLLNHLYTSTSENLLRNGRISDGELRGFRCYQSNNVPSGVVQSTNYYAVIAGHKSAVATASQLAQVESFRSQTSFGDVVRGMHLYGHQTLRPEAITVAWIQLV